MSKLLEVDVTAAEEYLKQFQRDINCLVEEDRNIRRGGLINLQKNFFKEKNSKILLYIFQNNLCKHILRILEDPIEKHREIAVEIIQKIAEISAGLESFLDRDIVINVIKSLLSRMSLIPFPESSEHIRLQIVEVITKYLKIYPAEFMPVMAETSLFLSKSLLDQYPDVKKQTSLLIIEISNALPKNIGHHSQSVVKSLAQNLQHQHSKVRKQTIEALVKLLLTEGAGPSMDIVMKDLQTISNDKINEVRKSAYQGIAEFLNGLSSNNLKIYEADLVGILINSLSDEQPEIQQLGINLIEDVGQNRKKLAMELEEIPVQKTE